MQQIKERLDRAIFKSVLFESAGELTGEEGVKKSRTRLAGCIHSLINRHTQHHLLQARSFAGVRNKNGNKPRVPAPVSGEKRPLRESCV